MVSTAKSGGAQAPAHKPAHKAAKKADKKPDAPKATAKAAQPTTHTAKADKKAEPHAAHSGVSKAAAHSVASYVAGQIHKGGSQTAKFSIGDTGNGKKADGKGDHKAGKAGEKAGKQAGKANEPKKHDVDVTVVDWFNDGDGHGEEVSKIVDKSGKHIKKDDVKQVQFNQSDLPDELADTNLDEYITRYASDPLNDLSAHLEEIGRNPGKTKVVNHSGGAAPIEIYADIFEPSLYDPGNISYLAKKLGLPADATKQQVQQASIDRIQNTLANSQQYKDAKTRYDQATKALKDQGIVTVIAAGNTGVEEINKLKEAGNRFDQSFVDSVNANNNVLLVNTVDQFGKKGKKTDIPYFNTPETQTDFAVSGMPDGNSFAAPAVAAAVAEIKTYLPDASFNTIMNILKRSATDHANISQQNEGHGVIDIEKAIAIAKRRAS